MFDIIIRNGTVIDGTGSGRYVADIGIKDKKIIKIGELHNERGEKEIDATDKFVCPGFIDVNNHSDTYWQLVLSPDQESLVYQGITTIIGGNCGSSLAPLTSIKSIESIQKWADIKKVSISWLNLKEFFDFIKEKELPINFGTLIGHATIRRGILGDEARSLTHKELNFIKEILDNSLDEGALGFSTGLAYTHARMTPREEIVDLAKITKKYKGVYATHLKEEGDNLIESLEEAIEVAELSGVKLHISHLKAVGENNWSKMDEALTLIDQARGKDIDVTFDVYPYTNTGSVLYTLLPSWVAEGGKKMMIYRLKDPDTREKVLAEMRKSKVNYDQIEISISPLNKTLARKKIGGIAVSQSKSPEETLLDILIASEGRVIVSMEVLSEENVKRAIVHPVSIISTNGPGYSINHSTSGEIVHPRSFGTFIKVLAQYVREEKLLSWEEGIRKMTGLPAEKFGLKQRGMIKENFVADVLIFDPLHLESPANKENPYQYSRGIDFMLVNGKLTINEGEYVRSGAGEIIKG